MHTAKPTIHLYVGALVHSGTIPADVRVSPIFKSAQEFNQWLAATQRATLEGITVTFHSKKEVSPCPGDPNPE